MTRRPKQAVKLSVATTPRKQTTKPLQPLTKPSQDKKIKLRQLQKRKPKQVKTDEAVMFNKALDYLGNYLLFVGVSAVILALAYWFMDVFA